MYMYTYIFCVCMYICMYVYVCIYNVCVCVSVYIYIVCVIYLDIYDLSRLIGESNVGYFMSLFLSLQLKGSLMVKHLSC